MAEPYRKLKKIMMMNVRIVVTTEAGEEVGEEPHTDSVY